MSRVGDIVGAAEGREQLIARGLLYEEADEILAFRIFMGRAADPERLPSQADEDWQAGRINGRRYLEQVAPEELSR